MVSLMIQIAVYLLDQARHRQPQRPDRERQELSAGIWLGAVSITCGQLAAASMTT
jgi:putative membrane protein